MKTINQLHDGFDFHRFCTLSKRYFVEQKKQLLTVSLSLLGCLALFGICFGRVTFDTGNGALLGGMYHSAAFTFELIWLYVVGAIFATVAGSLTFSAFNSKSGRIHSLTVPAASSEKFILLILIYTLLADLLFLCGAVIADFLRALISDSPTIWTSGIFQMAEQTDMQLWPLLAILALIALFGQAVYTLGSALWPRRSFIKTYAACFLLQTSIFILIPLDFFINIATYFEKANFWICFALSVAVIAGIYYLAWLRFRKMQIVQRFMMN